MTIYKCTCGHKSCDQWTLDTQGSVGFDHATAMLYDAAPDLLAALQGLLTAIKPQHSLAHVFLDKAQNAARAAIAKAKGKTS